MEEGRVLAAETAEKTWPGSEFVAGVARYAASAHGVERPEKLTYYYRNAEDEVLRISFVDADRLKVEVRQYESEDEIDFTTVKAIPGGADLVRDTAHEGGAERWPELHPQPTELPGASDADLAERSRRAAVCGHLRFRERCADQPTSHLLLRREDGRDGGLGRRATYRVTVARSARLRGVGRCLPPGRAFLRLLRRWPRALDRDRSVPHVLPGRQLHPGSSVVRGRLGSRARPTPKTRRRELSW